MKKILILASFLTACATVQPLTDKALDLAVNAYGQDYCNAFGQSKIDLMPDVSPNSITIDCTAPSVLTGQVWDWAKRDVNEIGALSEAVREQVKLGISSNVELYCTSDESSKELILKAFNDSLKPNSVRIECK